MLVVFLLTMLVVVIPALHAYNTRYIQRIALFIGASQIALLALAGEIDAELSDFLVSGFNQAVSVTYSVVLQKISYLLFSL